MLSLKNKINTFLKSFGGNVTICYNREPNKVSSMTQASVDEAIRQNKLGKDVYFYINEGGTKQRDITKLRACFVDLDAGRDNRGNYLTTSKVLSKKKEMMQKIKTFPLSPTYVIETRNGYQVYWLLAGNHYANNYAKTWEVIQNKICNFFKDVGSDKLTKKINQIYRIPFLNWQKKWEGKQPFSVSIIVNNKNKRYTLSQLAAKLKGVSGLIGNHHGDSGKWQKNTIQKPLQRKTHIQQDMEDDYENENYTPKKHINQKTIQETISFLLEVKQILWYSKKEFMSRSAERLANELTDEFCV